MLIYHAHLLKMRFSYCEPENQAHHRTAYIETKRPKCYLHNVALNIMNLVMNPNTKKPVQKSIVATPFFFLFIVMLGIYIPLNLNASLGEESERGDLTSTTSVAAPSNPLEQFLFEGMDERDTKRINASFAELTAEQIEATAAHHDVFFTKDMFGNNRACMIRTLSGLSVDQIQAIANYKDIFFWKNMGFCFRNTIIETLSALSVEEIEGRAQVIAENQETFFSNVKAKTSAKAKTTFLTLMALVKLNVDQIQAIANHHDLLFTNDMSGDSRENIITALSNLSAEEIELRCQAIQANQEILFPDNESGGYRSTLTKMSGLYRSKIICQVINLSEEHVHTLAAQYQEISDYYSKEYHRAHVMTQIIKELLSENPVEST